MNTLSSLKRSDNITSLQSKTFDLVIIGGGVTGAGIALDAASRGLSVAQIEKEDFASGTSSRSTKLIHGGLRYLKQLEIGLVREVGTERAIVHQLAPHLVLPEKMLLPFIDGGTLGKFGTSIGLMVYDFLAGVEGEDKRKMLSKSETLELEPLLREDVLSGGGIYAEYRTDDSRLTIEIIKKAAEYGATSINYVKAEALLYEDGKVIGLKCKDKLTEDHFNIKAKYVVSAAGPWVDKIRKKDESLGSKHLFLSKGVHIVVPHDKFPLQQSVYFDVGDGRMIFTIPRNKVTYIGTTDTPYDGDINHVVTNMEDVDYLVKAVNNMFLTVNLKSEDVISSWAGLRPLIYEEGKSASEMSRKDEIFESESGLISIAGGKLTGYRKMAERIVDLVVKKYSDEVESKSFKKCFTDDIELGGGPFANAKDVENYLGAIKEKIVALGLPSYYAAYLVYNYGRQTEVILSHFEQFEGKAEVKLARAELKFCVEKELVYTPADFLSRRSGRLYFYIDTIDEVLDFVCEDLAGYFDWNDGQKHVHKEEIQTLIQEAAHFEYATVSQ